MERTDDCDEGEPWARRTSRRRRTRPIVRLAAALALAVCVVSAATVLWLFVDVRRQIVSLRIEMDRVSTSSNSVDDALQVCHTAAKDLRANASALSEKLNELRDKHLELQAQVDQAVKNLAAVSGQLAAAPELKGMPAKLADLERTVAQLGSSIGSFDGALTTTRKQAVNAATGVEEVKNMLHQLEARTNETIANMTANSRREEDIKQQISTVNSTLDQKVESLRTRIEDLTVRDEHLQAL
ncbi:hypothetical protein NE865_14066 [Phthorimaea operculella]|nr:hypothetical protein NE865_14066 [Phthorimaea operculella]